MTKKLICYRSGGFYQERWPNEPQWIVYWAKLKLLEIKTFTVDPFKNGESQDTEIFSL